MSQTKTFYADLPRLAELGDSGRLIVSLMMANNDVSLANQCIKRSKDERARVARHTQRGESMYFARLMCGHLHEALLLVEKIRADTELTSIVPRCGRVCQDSYYRLLRCLPGGAERRDFEKYVERLRNRAIFHYDISIVERALARRARNSQSTTGKVTFGDHTSLWRFEIADDVVDTMVCRELWGIPDDVPLEAEATRIATYVSDIGRSFVDFSGEFIFAFLRARRLLWRNFC